MYLNVDSGRFGSEMVKLPEQKNLMENEKVKTHLILILSMNAYDGGQGISDV